MLFRELLPRPGQRTDEKPIDDIDVFEYSTHCWAYLIKAAEVRFVQLAIDLVMILLSSNLSIEGHGKLPLCLTILIILCVTALLFKDRCPVSFEIVTVFPHFTRISRRRMKIMHR